MTKKSISKKRKLELELVAVYLWFGTFGKSGMSSEADQLHMSELRQKLTDKFDKCK